MHLTDKIREHLNKGYFDWGKLADFHEALSTVDHDILIQKLNYHDLRGTGSNWLFSFYKNRTHTASIGDYLSDLHFICCGITQGFILGPLLFLF